MISQVGQSWGAHSIRLELPVASVCVVGLSAAQRASLRHSYPGFIAETTPGTGEHDVECRAYRLEREVAISPLEVTANGQYAPRMIRRFDGIELTGINFEARIGLGPPHTPTSLGVAQEHEFARAFVIENFLRVLAAHRALEQGGVVLHSAGLVFDGRAYIFAGRSGAGKTTLARKAYEYGTRVLSDDLNLLLPGQGGYVAFAVPFTGELGRTLDHEGGRESYPVAAVALLERGERLETETLGASATVARLLAGCPFVNTDAEESAALFDVLTGLVGQVPVIGLRCRRSDGFDAIADALKSGIDHA